MKMKKRTFVALYDLLVYLMVSIPLILVFIYFVFFATGGKILELEWYILLLISFSIAIPFGTFFMLERIEINMLGNYIKPFYFVDIKKNDLDFNCNWIINLDQIINVEIVRLNKLEKKKYTSSKFIFNKYLKITMEYENVKYLYVSHYSNRQIRKMISMIKLK